MSEARLTQEIRLGISELSNVRIFRNNTGRLQNSSGEWVDYGLVQGSSDLIGWTTVTVTPDMVGRKLALFTAIEVKTKTGRVSESQTNFINRVREAGGLAGVARSVEDARKILNDSIRDLPTL